MRKKIKVATRDTKNTSDNYCVSGIDHCTHVVDGCARGTKENSKYTLAVMCVRAPPLPPPLRTVPPGQQNTTAATVIITRARNKNNNKKHMIRPPPPSDCLRPIRSKHPRCARIFLLPQCLMYYYLLYYTIDIYIYTAYAVFRRFRDDCVRCTLGIF